MDPSFITAPTLRMVRLLATNCELSDTIVYSDAFNFEMNHQINVKIHTSEKSQGFDIFTNTDVIGTSCEQKPDGGKIKISCKFLATFDLPKDIDKVQDYEPITEVFANQVYPTVRQHLVDILCQMGVNCVTMPYSLTAASLKKEVPKKK